MAAGDMYRGGGRSRDSATVAHMTSLLDAQAKRPVTLTAIGHRIICARAERQTELIHYLLYTGWDDQQAGYNAPLWTYRRVCELLWDKEDARINSSQIVAELAARFDEELASKEPFKKIKLSVSGKTIRGVTVWLEQLQPPAIHDGMFARRTACSRELLLLGIGWVYRDSVGQPDTNGLLNSADLPLTRERREALYKLCLLEPAALERMLRAVISAYPNYISEGTTGGALNRFIRLHRMPMLTDEALLI